MSSEPITTYCPACGKTFNLPADLNGKKILCKGCQTHFIVQADKPGVPAAAPQPPKAAAVPVAAVVAPAALVKPAQPAATPAAKTAMPAKPGAAPSPPQVVAAPAAPTPGSSDLPTIPFDDVPVPLAGGGEDASMPTVGKPKALEKVKIESKGPYLVAKLVTTGKMVHVGIESALNDWATEGWRLQQILTVHEESYAVLHREQSDKPVPASKDEGSHA